MKKFWIVFKYEFSRQMKNKIFLVITSLLLIASLIGGYIVSNKASGSLTPQDPGIVEEASKTDLYIFTEDIYKDYILQLEDLGDYQITFMESEDALKTKVEESEEIGLVVEDFDKYKKMVTGTSLMQDLGSLDATLTKMYRDKLIVDSGLDLDLVNSLQSKDITVDMVNLGADGIIGYAYVYAFSFFLYMAINIFGGIVSSSVVTEKTSKAMELLITSADATSLITGKVFAIGLSCIIQLVLVVSGFVGVASINLRGTPIMSLLSSMSLFRADLLLLALFLFIVGFFSILFLFAGLSSFAAKPEDANTVAMPLVMITLVVFMVNISSLGTDFINSPVMKVVSYIPILSPFLLFSRYALFGLSSFELLLGIATNIIGGVLLIWMAAVIYRSGTLHYGNSISIKKIIKSFKK